MAGPAIEVAPPTRAPREGGLFTAADERSNERLAISDNLVFQSDGYTLPRTEAQRCDAEGPPPDNTFDGSALG